MTYTKIYTVFRDAIFIDISAAAIKLIYSKAARRTQNALPGSLGLIIKKDIKEKFSRGVK